MNENGVEDVNESGMATGDETETVRGRGRGRGSRGGRRGS